MVVHDIYNIVLVQKFQLLCLYLTKEKGGHLGYATTTRIVLLTINKSAQMEVRTLVKLIYI